MDTRTSFDFKAASLFLNNLMPSSLATAKDVIVSGAFLMAPGELCNAMLILAALLFGQRKGDTT